MSNTNPVQPTVTLSIGAVEYHLIFDFAAIAEAEELTGRPLILGLDKKTVRNPSINFVRAMLFAATRRHHPEVSYQQIAALIVNRVRMVKAWNKVLDCWGACIEEIDGDEEVDPATGQR